MWAILKMKHLTIIFLLLISTKGFTQEPPAIFKFNFNGISKNTTELFKNFEIRTNAYRENIEPVENGHLDLITYSIEENGVSKIKTQYVYELGYYHIENDNISVFINGFRPGTKEIALLSLRKKNTNQYLNIYIRFCRLLEFGEEVFLEKLEFKEGNFFYDMCGSRGKYGIECQEDYYPKIDLDNLGSHRISIKKLNRIKKRNSCK